MSRVPKAGIEPARSFERRILNPREPYQGVPECVVYTGETDVTLRRVSGDPRPFPTQTRQPETSRRGFGSENRNTLWFPRLA